MYTETGPGRSSIVAGVLLGLLLIALALVVRSCGDAPRASLRDQFVPGPTDPAQSVGIPIPDSLRSAGQTAQAQLGLGQPAPALTPSTQSGPLEVRVTTIDPVDGGLRVAGSVHNRGSAPLTVPLRAFRFRDQDGKVYAAQGDASAVLQPGQSESFDLTLPTQAPSELVLLLELPEGGVKIEMVLLAGGVRSAP